LALSTRGGSRVPELGTLGSVRGALSNERPYRDPVHQNQSRWTRPTSASRCASSSPAPRA